MIAIVPWRTEWRDDFQKIGRELRQSLSDLALRIDHIGSTSVPGLAAKDVIDIQISVAVLEPALDVAIQQLGFARIPGSTDHIPPGAIDQPDDWAKWLFKSTGGQRAANIHVRVAGRPNQRYPILFRDYLRTHPSTAQAYERLKVAIASLLPEDIEAYSQVKDPVCDIIVQAAEAWAEAARWRPGPTDC